MNSVVSDQLSREFEDVVRELQGQAIYDGLVWWLLDQKDGAVMVGPSQGFVELVEETVRLHGKGVSSEGRRDGESSVRRDEVSTELVDDQSDRGPERGGRVIGSGKSGSRVSRLGDL